MPHANSYFDRIRFILVEPSRAGNVGASARAIKTMGFKSLVLVNPRDPNVLDHEEAVAFASGAQDVLSAAKIVGSFDSALEGCHVAAAVSARLREFSPPVQAPREFAEQCSQSSALQVGLIFGNERFGLPNELVQRCNVLINIATDPVYGSLNLAQAVQIVAYECRMAAQAENSLPSRAGFSDEVANVADVERMFNHLEEALIKVNFIDRQHPKKLMTRLRRLFARTTLEIDEVNILRGIANQVLQLAQKQNEK